MTQQRRIDAKCAIIDNLLMLHGYALKVTGAKQHHDHLSVSFRPVGNIWGPFPKSIAWLAVGVLDYKRFEIDSNRLRLF